MDAPSGSPGTRDTRGVRALCDRLAALPEGTELAAAVRGLGDQLDVAERTLKRQAITHQTILEIANRVNASGLDLRRIEGYTASMARGQFGVLRVFLWRADVGEEGQIRVTVPDRQALGGNAFHAEGALARWLSAHPEPMDGAQLPALGREFHEVRGWTTGGVRLTVPLLHTASDGGVELVGVLGLGDKIGGGPFSDADRELLAVLANLIAIALHNAHLYHRSIVDALTRVYSRGHFDAHLGSEIARARRHHRQEAAGTPGGADVTRLSLVLCDIDHFKRVNDSHGHQTGDAVLKAIGALFMGSVRAMDVVSRYGGEEFGIVFPETKRVDALQIAERLRDGVERLTCTTPAGAPLPVSASFGVATWPDDADDVRSLVAAADKALYRAKHEGRNRVVTAAADAPAGKDR